MGAGKNTCLSVVGKVKIKMNDLEVINMVEALIGDEGMKALGAALAIGLSAIGAAIAEKDIGAAAVGAMAEKEELFVKGLIMTVLPETIVLFGFVIAYLILG